LSVVIDLTSIADNVGKLVAIVGNGKLVIFIVGGILGDFVE
jgi:hypothetical protein